MMIAERTDTNIRHELFYLFICLLASLSCSLYELLFARAVYETPLTDHLLTAAATFIVIFAFLFAIRRFNRFFDFLINHRVSLSAALLILCVIFSISGSSIAQWGPILGNDPNQGTLFGMSRAIRSDEWMVSTPFALSQGVSGSHMYSPLIRGGDTDVTMVGASPAFAVIAIFRPFRWGYLLMGGTRGLSFYWMSQMICLPLVTYQFALRFSGDNREISLFAAVMVTFAPMVQWWFAPTLLIYGQALVLSLDGLLKSRTAGRKWLFSGLLAWLVGCYLFVLYPAWQVPLFYVFLTFGICVIRDHVIERKRLKSEQAKRPAKVDRLAAADKPAETDKLALADKLAETGKPAGMGEPTGTGKHSKADTLQPIRSFLIPLFICLVVSVVLIAVAFYQSMDTIRTVSGTVYPGARIETGGHVSSCFHGTAAVLLSALEPYNFLPNVCEAALFFGLFPLGIILALYQGIKRRDFTSWALIVVYTFLNIFMFIGFPSWLARATLLSNCTSSRVLIATGYLDVMLLVRAISVWNLPVESGRESSGSPHPLAGTVLSIVIPIVYTAAMIASIYRWYPQLVGASYILFVGLTCLAFGLATFAPWGYRHANPANQGLALFACSLIVLCVGLSINPIQQGTAAPTESDFVQKVSEVTAEDPDADWMSYNTTISQACIVGGASTINSVNVYPNLELWHKIDPDGEYENIYNRYAHVSVEISDETRFELNQNDAFTVYITPEDLLYKLNVTYFVSDKDLAGQDTENVTFEPVSTSGSLTIYHVQPA